MEVPIGRGSRGPGKSGFIGSYRKKLKIGRRRTTGCFLNTQVIDGDIAQLSRCHTGAGHKAQPNSLARKGRKVYYALKPLVALIARYLVHIGGPGRAVKHIELKRTHAGSVHMEPKAQFRNGKRAEIDLRTLQFCSQSGCSETGLCVHIISIARGVVGRRAGIACTRATLSTTPMVAHRRIPRPARVNGRTVVVRTCTLVEVGIEVLNVGGSHSGTGRRQAQRTHPAAHISRPAAVTHINIVGSGRCQATQIEGRCGSSDHGSRKWCRSLRTIGQLPVGSSSTIPGKCGRGRTHCVELESGRCKTAWRRTVLQSDGPAVVVDGSHHRITLTRTAPGAKPVEHKLEFTTGRQPIGQSKAVARVGKGSRVVARSIGQRGFLLTCAHALQIRILLRHPASRSGCDVVTQIQSCDIISRWNVDHQCVCTGRHQCRRDGIGVIFRPDHPSGICC